MAKKTEPGQKAASLGIVWLTICGLFLLFDALYSLPEEPELVEVEGQIADIEIHGSNPEVRWFEIQSNGETLDLCIADMWRDLRRPAIGDQISIKGYEPNFSPCDYQAMEVVHSDDVLVSYLEFTRRKSLKIDFFRTYVIGPLALIAVILMTLGLQRNRKRKSRERGTR